VRWPTRSAICSTDPAVNSTGTPYAYTGDNPLNYTDLLGQCGDLFHFACSAADWVKNNATDTSTLITVGAIGLGIDCPECDLAVIALDVTSNVVNQIGTYEAIKSGNVTESTIDVIGDLVSLGGLGTEVSTALKETGEGAHIATEFKEAHEDAEKLSGKWGTASNISTFTEFSLPYLNDMFAGTAC